MPTTIRLYDIIKQESEKKNRPLKIVCDWDEVMQPVNPKIWYEIIKVRGWYEGDIPNFEEWFKWFWENSKMQFSGLGGESIKTGYTANKWIENYRKIPEQFEEEVRKPFFRLLNAPDFYEEAPLLVCAADLCQALDEQLIGELVFISTTWGKDNRKRRVFNRVFSPHLSKCQIFLNKTGHHTRTGMKRCDWIKESHPDFDIFVDDNPSIITETMEKFGSEKIYALPLYKYLESDWNELIKKENVYLYPCHLWKDKNLLSRKKVAQEPKNEQISEREREREQYLKNPPYLFGLW